MAKRKHSAALFEVIAQGDSKGLQTPAWVDGGESAPATAERPAPSLKRPPGLDGDAAPTPAPAAPAHAEPMVSLADGRLRLSLGYVSCLVISLGLIVLLALAYQLGQAGRPAPPGETTPAGPMMFGDQGDTGRDYDYDQAQQAALALLPGAGRRILIIQDRIASTEDARAIQRYLWSKGLTPFVNIDQTNGRISVLDTVDVDNMTDDELQAYQQRLAAWGSDAQWLLSAQYKFDQTRTETPR